MAKSRTEVVASSLLTAWTDADTAMQVVGLSIGVFGPEIADPARALSRETPLRNALFDVLLSLVEGAALEMRPAGDGHYAFRWRDDIAVAGLASAESVPIDLDVPPPSSAEVARIVAERDAAIARAEVAEALAAEREQLLTRRAGASTAKSAPPKPAAARPSGARRAPVKPAIAKAAAKAAPAKPARVKGTPAAKPAAAIAPTSLDLASTEVDEREHLEPNEIVYLAPAPAEERSGAKWAGYTLEQARARLSSVERVADDA